MRRLAFAPTAVIVAGSPLFVALGVLVSGCSRRSPPDLSPPGSVDASVTTFAAAVRPDDAHDDAAVTPSAIQAAADEMPIAKGPRALEGRKVLQVGDSMVGGRYGLTRALETKLSERGATIARFTKESESIPSFDRSSTLRDLVRRYDPDIVIVTLGANDAHVPHPEAYARNIESIVRRIGSRECWWIGPPSIAVGKTRIGRADDAPSLADVLREHMGGCRFFDSTALDLERLADRIHPSEHGAAVWAEAFWAELERAR